MDRQGRGPANSFPLFSVYKDDIAHAQFIFDNTELTILSRFKENLMD